MARDGELADPHVPPPAALRPFLAFAKYPPKALVAARRVLDDDADHRARVRAAMRPEAMGDAGALFLDRPDGWEDALGAMVDAFVDQRTSQGEARADRRATKQLELTKGTLTKVLGEIDAERTARLAAEARADALAAEVEALRIEVARWRDERAAAVRELKVVEARDAARLEELRVARDALDAVEARAGRAGGEDGRSPGAVASRTPDVPATDPAPAVAPVAPVDPAAVATIEALAGSLDAALRSVEALRERLGLAPATEPPARRRTDRGPARRRPTRLPVGIFDDAPEAVGPLLRVPDMQVYVDGYNLSLTGWSGLDLELQRARLLDVLGGLEATVPASFLVVFDGAPTGEGLPRESRLRSVQVRFTEPGTEADDVVLELVESTPLHRPVLVVSSDRRVKDGARERGANVVSSDQFLAFLRS